MKAHLLAATAAACLLLAGGAASQNFPTKPVRVINPAAPGGNSDIFFHQLRTRMSEALGQQLVIEYRAGAGGTIGGDVIAKSAPDGYTTGLVAASFLINPSIFKNIPYDTRKDFTGLGIIVDVPTGLGVHPSLPARNVKELVALAKKRPGELFYSTSGPGTIGHLATEMLNMAAGIKLVHVPYKGAGPAMIDLIAGQVQLQFASMPLLLGHVKQGRLRMIAQTGAKRAGIAQDVPTMQESGIKDYVVQSLFGFVGPARIPRPIAERLNGALVTAIKDPANSKALLAGGAEPVGSTLDEHARVIQVEIERWARVAKAAGIQPQ